MTDQSMSDGSSDGGIYSEPLFHDGTLLHDIGKALAWVYCNTRLCSLCQGIYRYSQIICLHNFER